MFKMKAAAIKRRKRRIVLNSIVKARKNGLDAESVKHIYLLLLTLGLGTTSSVKQTGNGIVFNVRPNSQNQFKGYASDQILNVICVFEAPISVSGNAEKIATFFVIEKGKQSLLGRETAIGLKVLRLGLEVRHIQEISAFPK
ncbi:uncharacterized protein LOC122626245 [Drosophila teissieri]|uniref:uncharacterized protein LOC122626245 n=1 Tax=Drosophila teissieri TaxID=7243 RepID=UPI001CBA1007|nr:uncharacterized protein LOC122626245 [Drosophila teissieri]XP_043662369.1 uncharacterized protein LOC122626245 [Drosophila teissieri]